MHQAKYFKSALFFLGGYIYVYNPLNYDLSLFSINPNFSRCTQLFLVIGTRFCTINQHNATN